MRRGELGRALLEQVLQHRELLKLLLGQLQLLQQGELRALLGHLKRFKLRELRLPERLGERLTELRRKRLPKRLVELGDALLERLQGAEATGKRAYGLAQSLIAEEALRYELRALLKCFEVRELRLAELRPELLAELLAEGLGKRLAELGRKRLSKLLPERQVERLVKLGDSLLEGQHGAEATGKLAEALIAEEAAERTADRRAELAEQIAEEALRGELLALLKCLKVRELLLAKRQAEGLVELGGKRLAELGRERLPERQVERLAELGDSLLEGQHGAEATGELAQALIAEEPLRRKRLGAESLLNAKRLGAESLLGLELLLQQLLQNWELLERLLNLLELLQGKLGHAVRTTSAIGNLIRKHVDHDDLASKEDVRFGEEN